MKSSLPSRWLLAIAITIAMSSSSSSVVDATTRTALEEALDKAILDDILESYADHSVSECIAAASASSAATSFSYDWPGTNADSNWYDDFVGFEENLFQAIMSHADTNGRSWSIRIGTGGNMYSHYAPDMHGETFPPQKHSESPWIDEVQQTVSVNGALNQLNMDYDFPEYCTGNPASGGVCKQYFIHQAGAYQRDESPYTDIPFYSPSLAHHCSGVSCTFASWGTQAHVVTPFTSPIMYINRYTNCGDGAIEHTQMIHNFADPTNSASTDVILGGRTAVDQVYFNVGWGGVRSSALPYALEPDKTTGVLEYADVNNVDYLSICPWGEDGDGAVHNPPTWRGERSELKWLRGYTTFVEPRLLVNQDIPPVLPWCRDNSIDCFAQEPNGCMVRECTDAQIAAGTHTRLQLKVAAGAFPNCRRHDPPNSPYGDLIGVQCDMRDTGFGRTTPYLSGAETCSPWADMAFVNTVSGAVLPVSFITHWSWSPNNKKVYFGVYETDATTAINLVNTIFNNAGNGEELIIDVSTNSVNVNVPGDYDPSTFNSFTYIYGNGEEYDSGGLEGRSRRRLGGTIDGPGTRDYTVFTINWYGGAVLEAGSTYSNRGFYLTSDLGSVESTAGALVDKTKAEEIGLERWTPRAVDVYESTTTDSFAVVAAAEVGGTSTTCASQGLVVACSGKSTPQANMVPFFYVTCGDNTYFGPDPYHFTPSFGASFPGHGPDLNNPVRSYVCNGEDVSVRPTWKMMGFFDPTSNECNNLSGSTHDATVCDTGNAFTTSPTKSPVTESPTTVSPTQSPVTGSPTKSPVTASPVTDSPTKSPVTASPVTDTPTKSPVTASPITDTPTGSPTKSPVTASPVTDTPTKSPVTASPTTKSPTQSPITDTPTKSPVTTSPTTESPTQSPITNTPTKSPVTASPTTESPTQTPVTNTPTKSPMTASPTTESPTQSPVTESPTTGPGFTMTVTGSTTFAGVDPASLNQASMASFVAGVKSVIEDTACPNDSSTNDCTANVLRVTEAPDGANVGGRLLSERRLATSLLVDFELIIQAVCDLLCSDAQAVQDIANSVYSRVTDDLRDAVNDGSFVEDIQSSSTELTALLANAETTGDFSPVVIPILTLLSNWYPDWGTSSATCLNDGYAPYYMKAFGTYFEKSLDACCERFFSWNLFKCKGDSATVPSGFYPNWGKSEGKCLNSTEETLSSIPDYMLKNPEQWMYDDIESCCENYYSYDLNECIALTSGNPFTSATGKWYVDWKLMKCVKDCKGDQQCGGFAKKWDDLYDSPSACCDRISWIERSECVI